MDRIDENSQKIALTIVTGILTILGLISSTIWWHASEGALKEPTISQQTTNILSTIKYLFISGTFVIAYII